MKKTFRRITALILSILMALGTLSAGVTVSAEDSYSVGDIIEYGTYPQSKVEDEELIAALNAVEGTWVSYGYYSGSGSYSDGQMVASDYMRYKDVSYNGEKYRAVTFDSYRPYLTGYTSSASYTYQDDNGYTTGNVYWFNYEPIKWRVLDPSTGLVMCATVIDSQAYNNYMLESGTDEYSKTAYWGNSAKTYYANNYAESSIREWLNNDFYNTAFSADQKANILTTTIDNSAYSTSFSAYDNASTSDKVYLLSYSDVLNSSYGFSTSTGSGDTARLLKGSDYAKAQGLYVYSDSESTYDGCSYWRLRSAGNYSIHTCSVDDDGYVDYNDGTYITDSGIVPAMNLSSFETDEEQTYSVGDIIEYGNYPQSKVEDEATIAILNNLAGDNADWTSYGYYSGNGSDGSMAASDYMRYTDVLYNGSKYRGIYFDTYRPYFTGGVTSTTPSNLTKQKTNGYICGNVYWFKYEPLKWRVLDPDTGMVMCDSIIDSQAFNNYFGADHSGDPDINRNACDYEKSSLREWLNADFYGTAFSASQKENIALTTLDNSAYSTSYSQYGSASTTDKIYILSWNDAKTESYGFTASTSSGDSARILEGSDYAKSQGLEVNTSSGCSGWRLRTATYGPNILSGVESDGSISISYSTHDTAHGIVPVMNLSSIRSDTSADESTVSNGDGTHTVYDETGKAVSTDDCTYITTIIKDATCTEKGTKAFTCKECGDSYTEEIPVIDHTHASAVKENEIAATCTTDGSYDSVVYCSVCNTELSRKTVPVPALGHNFVNYVPNDDLTCTTDRTKTAKCTRCDATDTQVIAGSATGHRSAAAVKENEVAATCTADGSYDSVVYCTLCGEELSRETVTVPALGHSFTNYVYNNDATCTENGTETAKCDRCDVTDTRDIADSALGHTPKDAVKENEVAPTCTAEGSYDSVVYCSVCNAEISRDTVTVPALGHSFTNYVYNNDATCTENGTETAKCDRCDVTYTKEAEGTLLHHDWAYTYEWAEDCSECTATVRCNNCGETLTFDGDVSTESETPATCTEAGSRTYAAVFTNGKESHTERKTVEIPAAGHDYNTEYVWRYDFSGNLVCSAAATCKNDSSYVVTETSSAMLISALGASCYSEGAETYIAEFSSEPFETQEKTITVTKTAHTPSDAVKENETSPTCTSDGSYDSVVYCSVCHDEISRETIKIDAFGHTPEEAVKENETAPTCAADGSYDSVVYCSVCKAEISRETVKIPTAGHTDADGDNVCDVCGTDLGGRDLDEAVILVSGGTSVNYGADVTVTATGKNIPDKYCLAIFAEGKEIARGDNESVSYDFGSITSDINYTVKIVDKDGNVQSDSTGRELIKDGGTITCKDNFFTRIFALFRAIFRSKYEITVKPEGISSFLSAC